jgi:hypothetical protein
MPFLDDMKLSFRMLAGEQHDRPYRLPHTMRILMNKTWRGVLLLAALNFVFIFASVAFAQVPIAGGYAETASTDPEAVAAARFAIAKEGRKERARIFLISIERAEVQVVAGLNYKLWLKVKSHGKTQDVSAVVYKNLKGQFSLTGWDVGNGVAGTDTANSATTIEELVASVGEAFTSKTLAKLDAEHPYLGRVRIVLENSLAEDGAKDQFEVKTFKTLAGADNWTKSSERGEDGPSRIIMTLKRCSKGICTYDFDGGIQHNALYIKKITYGFRNGRPYIKTIYLLDGD